MLKRGQSPNCCSPGANCESGNVSIARFAAEKKGFESVMARVEFDTQLNGLELAFRSDGSADDLGPTGFFWLGGFKSDMSGTKAENLATLAHDTRRNLVRFDYSGHGESAGVFVEGTISAWLEEATHMFLSHTHNKRIIVGSSMGGWLALLLARKLMREDGPAFRRIGGLVLLAPAADMTHDLMWEHMTQTERAMLAEDGLLLRANHTESPHEITMSLIEDGYNHLILKQGLAFPFPIRILHGTEDAEVPPAHAIKTFESLKSSDTTLTFIKGGDHRLSKPNELAILRETVLQLAFRSDGERV
jgi:pimeloyl-ACP methyl ester carboxylesterase